MRRVAAVTKEFMEKVGRSVTKIVWQSPTFKAGKKYVTASVITDPEDPKDPGYYFFSRVGKDSVAFLLYDDARGDECWGILQQWHGPLKRFGTGAFTGSMDKDIEPIQICQEEAVEEAGYHVASDRICPIGKYAVSAMTDEEVNLYVVDVSGIPQQKAEPENIYEQNTFIKWFTEEQVRERCEWKACLILDRYTRTNELLSMRLF